MRKTKVVNLLWLINVANKIKVKKGCYIKIINVCPRFPFFYRGEPHTYLTKCPYCSITPVSEEVQMANASFSAHLVNA